MYEVGVALRVITQLAQFAFRHRDKTRARDETHREPRRLAIRRGANTYFEAAAAGAAIAGEAAGAAIAGAAGASLPACACIDDLVEALLAAAACFLHLRTWYSVVFRSLATSF